jgi:hypothetical protein
MKRLIAPLIAVVCAAFFLFGGGIPRPRAAGDGIDAALQSIRPEAIRAGMRFLSDDLLEGRETGSRGYDIAAKYIATEFEGMGLAGAGANGTYFQSVPLRSARADEAKAAVTLVRGRQEETMVFRKDFITFGDPGREDTSVEAPVVYVGAGVTAPEQGYDDYAGIDAKGKIVAVVFEAPPRFESSLRAHYSSFEVKAENAVAHGAVGLIGLADPVLEGMYPFSEQVRDLAFPRMSWLDDKGRPNDYYPELKAKAFFSMEAVNKLFEGSAHTADEVFAANKAGKPLSFELPVTAKIRNGTKLGDVHGANVVARLAGSDPSLADQYVVFTAHLTPRHRRARQW